MLDLVTGMRREIPDDRLGNWLVGLGCLLLLAALLAAAAGSDRRSPPPDPAVGAFVADTR